MNNHASRFKNVAQMMQFEQDESFKKETFDMFKDIIILLFESELSDLNVKLFLDSSMLIYYKNEYTIVENDPREFFEKIGKIVHGRMDVLKELGKVENWSYKGK